MDYINAIKSKLLLSDIVGRKVKLRKRGNNFVGLCPFHHEKTPSFSVSNIKGLYYCFGCSAHGDIFEFISQTEGLSFKDVAKKLASMAGVELPTNFNAIKEYKGLFTALDLATSWFARKNQEVLSYLEQRKISPEMVNKFKIGYAPKSGLKEHLNSLGIEDKILVEVGLMNRNSNDYFHSRVMFPIHDVAGRTIAFGGRALNSEHHPKYLNSPENQLFKKKDNLYGLNFALSEIHKKQHVFVVEGYIDVIALHQTGISNTVAPLGTAISVEQIKNLWNLTKEVSICMDGDSAGYNAAIRVAKLVLPILEPGYTLNFVTLPREKDPYDVCSQLEYNKEAVLSLLNHSTKLHSEYLWEYVVSNGLQNSNTPEKYSILEYRFMECVNAIRNTNIKKYYRDYFYTKISELRGNFKKRGYNRKTNNECFHNKSPELIETEQNQTIILRIAIEFPEILNHPIFFEQFSIFEFNDQNMKKLQQCVVDIISEKTILNKETLLQNLERYRVDTVVNLICEKTKILNSQLSKRVSAEAVWNNIMLLKELNALKKEKVKARLSGNFDLEENLITQIKRVEDNMQEMQMEFINLQ
ncbi:MAG: DNA primase [Wolbachia endosymbiont of Tyrophagus putrescentiae]|nr:DNA primase [Wolbachia endosymbiont of Tyrophagus putrescentiae]